MNENISNTELLDNIERTKLEVLAYESIVNWLHVLAYLPESIDNYCLSEADKYKALLKKRSSLLNSLLKIKIERGLK
jgi:hypothetical protein